MAPTLRQRKADHTAVVASEQNTPVASPAVTKSKKLPVRAKSGKKGTAGKKAAKQQGSGEEDGSEDEEVEVSQLSQASPALKNTKMTFDDEDDFVAASAKPVVEAPKKKVVEEEEEEESSDDEAPEAVSTSTAAAQVMKAASAQQKAAQEKAAAEKKKRQDRDARLKQQAVERKKEAEEKKTAEAAAAAEESSEQEDAAPAVPENNITNLDTKSNKRSIPALLPEEYLNSDSEDDDLSEDEDDATGKPRAKKRKIERVEKDLSKASRGPKDEVLGSTVYRISKEVDTRLAPKKSNYASGMKGALLQRGRKPVKTGKGFFKK